MSTVTLPWPSPPLTQNGLRRMHHLAEAREKAKALDAARWVIRNAKLAPITKAIVILHWQQPDRRRRDGDGADPTKKMCIDALVKEGVLPDDSWQYVIHSGVTCHPPQPGKPGALWLAIHDLNDPATAGSSASQGGAA